MKIKHIIIFLMFAMVSSSSQDLSKLYIVDQGSILSSDFIRDIPENYDVNGKLAAGLLVVSDISGLSYSANNGMVKDVLSRGEGEDLLYLSPSESLITIYADGYERFQLILTDHGIKLESGRVWEVKISGDRKLDLIPISIVRNESDSDIYLDDEYIGKETSQKVTPGQHTIRIEKKGYKTIEETINVSEDNILFNYELKSIDPVIVEISTSPTGATIFINDKEEGIANPITQKFLYPGKYILRIIKSGYLSYESEIEIKEEGNNKFNYNLEKNSALLELSVVPSGATVLINKEDYSNQSRIELPTGTYKIEIEKDGYYPEEEIVEIVLGEDKSKKFSLKKRTGSLQFSVKPYDAKVELKRNGELIDNWEGLKISKDLLVGEYELVVSKKGYLTEVKKVIVKENEITEFNTVLKSQAKESDEPNEQSIASSDKPYTIEDFNKLTVYPNPFLFFGQQNKNNIDGFEDSQISIRPLPLDKTTTIKIYNISGELLKFIKISNQTEVQWDLRQNDGTIVPNGVYIANISIPTFGEQNLKIIITKL